MRMFVSTVSRTTRTQKKRGNDPSMPCDILICEKGQLVERVGNLMRWTMVPTSSVIAVAIIRFVKVLAIDHN